MTAASVYTAMRREWDALPSWHPVKGLYVKEYPPYMIAPWEDPAAVQGERPEPIPPEEAQRDGLVRRLGDGRALLERDGALPLLLSADERESALLN